MSNSIKVKGNTSSKGAELRFSPQGTAFASFSVAGQNSRYDRQSQQYIDDGETLWFNVIASHELAEQVAEQLRPDGGSRLVTVTGHLKQRSYDTRDGEKRTVLDLVADSVCVHPPRVRQANDTGSPGWGGTQLGTQQQSSGWGGQQRPQQQQADPWGQPATDEPPF